MSSRAVRKVLKQKEAEAIAARLKLPKPEIDEIDGEEGEDEEEQLRATKRINLFAMLGEAGEEDSKGEEDEGEAENESRPSREENHAPIQELKKSQQKKKRKKKKGKITSLTVVPSGISETGTPAVKKGEDEIDRALRDLKIVGVHDEDSFDSGSSYADSPSKLQEYLRVESKNLDAQQEMRRLFGRAAISNQDDSNTPRRQQRGAGALRPSTQPGRSNLTLRRNIFASPKSNWPLALSAGLGMEMVEKQNVLEFTFVHSKRYQDVQRQFMICVMSMDPQRLINLLQQNPYHISTLLQVSEIAASERDNTTAGELLERALFSFGRSTHSKFSDALSRGTARLDFRKFENRELWLAVWRYIMNLALRGTWRTAEEYGRLLFALDPINDPYQMILLIDMLSLKAHQPNHLLNLYEALKSKIGYLPNMAYSISLAYHQLNQDSLAREYLAKAITRFPWVLTRLIQELSIDIELPSALWGRMVPEDDKYQHILCELYIHRSKDLWNLPDAKKLLIEVSMTIHNVPKYRNIQNPNGAIHDDWQNANEIVDGIGINLARHVIVSDITSVISLLPIRWKENLLSTYDPLPPGNSIKTYEHEGFPLNMVFGPPSQQGGMAPEYEGQRREPGMLFEFLRSLLPMLRSGEGEPAIIQNEIARRVQVTPHVPNAPGGWSESGEIEQTIQGQQQRHQEQEQGPQQPENSQAINPDWSVLEAILGVERTRQFRNLVDSRATAGRQTEGNGNDLSENSINREETAFPEDILMSVMDALHGDGEQDQSGDQYWGPDVEWEQDLGEDEWGGRGGDGNGENENSFEDLPDLVSGSEGEGRS